MLYVFQTSQSFYLYNLYFHGIFVLTAYIDKKIFYWILYLKFFWNTFCNCSSELLRNEKLTTENHIPYANWKLSFKSFLLTSTLTLACSSGTDSTKEQKQATRRLFGSKRRRHEKEKNYTHCHLVKMRVQETLFWWVAKKTALNNDFSFI